MVLYGLSWEVDHEHEQREDSDDDDDEDNDDEDDNDDNRWISYKRWRGMQWQQKPGGNKVFVAYQGYIGRTSNVVF